MTGVQTCALPILNQGGREDVLQIYFLCLALGFRGRYMNSSPEALASFSDAAAQQIASKLSAAGKISPNAQPRDRAQAEKRSLGPLVGVLLGCAVIIIGAIVGLQWSLHSTIEDNLQALSQKPASSVH